MYLYIKKGFYKFSNKVNKIPINYESEMLTMVQFIGFILTLCGIGILAVSANINKNEERKRDTTQRNGKYLNS